jgi:hypothetical protein
MKIRTLALATAAISLLAAPAIAQADFARANAPIEGESELAAPGILLGVLGAAAVVAGIAVASSDSDDNSVSG